MGTEGAARVGAIGKVFLFTSCDQGEIINNSCSGLHYIYNKS